MFKKKFIPLFLIGILCLSLAFATGCTQTETPAPAPAPAPVPETPVTPPATTPETGKTTTEGTAAESDVRHEKTIADKIVKDVKEVERASVFVTGETAYVGLAIRDTAEAAKAKEIKASVEKVVKEADPKIKTVMISEDMDIMTRLEEYGRDIEAGKPISGFVEEVRTMFNRVVPTT